MKLYCNYYSQNLGVPSSLFNLSTREELGGILLWCVLSLARSYTLCQCGDINNSIIQLFTMGMMPNGVPKEPYILLNQWMPSSIVVHVMVMVSTSLSPTTYLAIGVLVFVSTILLELTIWKEGHTSYVASMLHHGTPWSIQGKHYNTLILLTMGKMPNGFLEYPCI